jgi:hypothetical protein
VWLIGAVVGLLSFTLPVSAADVLSPIVKYLQESGGALNVSATQDFARAVQDAGLGGKFGVAAFRERAFVVYPLSATYRGGCQECVVAEIARHYAWGQDHVGAVLFRTLRINPVREAGISGIIAPEKASEIGHPYIQYNNNPGWSGPVYLVIHLAQTIMQDQVDHRDVYVGTHAW